MVARLNRVKAKRRPCEHEISGLQTLAETTEITAKPLRGLRRTTGHGPQGSSLTSGQQNGDQAPLSICECTWRVLDPNGSSVVAKLVESLGGLDKRPEGAQGGGSLAAFPRSYAGIPSATLADGETVRSQFLSLRH